MKLNQWADKNGISYQTALRWFHAKKIPASLQMDTGTILVDDTAPVQRTPRTCIYARVSNQSRKAELEYQVDRVAAFAAASGLAVDKIYKEVASGMNDNRRELWKMLDTKPTTIVVEHKDRLTRFGFNYLERLLSDLGCKVVVVNRDQENEDDLLKDLVSIITSFCCRLYGLRRGQNKVQRIKRVLNKDE